MGRSCFAPSPPRDSGRRGRNPSPRRGCGGGQGRDLPNCLLVRNIRYDCRDKDLRRPFGKFGAIKNLYLPKDYNTGIPRGFGFVSFENPADAADAKHQMDGCVLLGRELSVVYAEGNEKKPSYMRARNEGIRRNSGRSNRRRSPSRYCRSPPQRHARSRPRSYDYASPRRSVSPHGRRDSRERSYRRRESPGRSYSRSPQLNGSRSRSQRPARGRSLSRSRSRSVSRSRNPRRSPRHEEEFRSEANGKDRRSPSQ